MLDRTWGLPFTLIVGTVWIQTVGMGRDVVDAGSAILLSFDSPALSNRALVPFTWSIIHTAGLCAAQHRARPTVQSRLLAVF